MADRDSDSEHPRSSADDRDKHADKRDRSAEHRDRAADERDLREEQRHRREDQPRVTHRASERAWQRKNRTERRSTHSGRRRVDVAAAAELTKSAAGRDTASARRREGAEDRVRASDDRQAASADRDAAAQERDFSSIDELTGAHRRGPGLVELEREWSRADRTQRAFVVAFVDVDGLKARNDSLGHAAGDALLVDVVTAILGRLRSYDLIVRFGGDEFVCGLMDLDAVTASQRFALVEADLRLRGASITVGLAELQKGDSLSDLIARADEVLYQKRSLRPSTR